MRALKSGVMALLAANTALTMLLTDNALQIKGLDSYYSQFESRCNALVAGARPALARMGPGCNAQHPQTPVLHLLAIRGIF